MSKLIRFKGIIGTLAQIITDRFAGRLAWATNIERMIMYYDSTNYGIMARRDVLESFDAGIQDATVTAGQPMVAGASGRYQTQDAATFLGTVGAVARAGDVVPGSFEIGAYLLAGRPLTYGISGEVGFLGVRNADGVFSVDVGEAFSCELYGEKSTGTQAYHGLRQLKRTDLAGAFAYSNVLTWDDLGIVYHLPLLDSLGAQRLSATGAATLASVQASNLSGSGVRPLVADDSGNIAYQDAATFANTIGAIKRTGDAVEALFEFSDTGAGRPPVIVKDGTAGGAGSIGLRSSTAGAGLKNWSIGITSSGDSLSISADSDNWAIRSNFFLLTRSGGVYFGGFIGSGSRPLVAGPDGTVTPQDAATFRATIGIPGTVTREMVIQPLPITNAAPDVVTVGPSGSMRSFGFDGVTQIEELFYHIDIQHDYVAGTDVVAHVHWMPSTAGSGDVVWQWDYQWVQAGGTFPAPTTAVCPAVAAGGAAWADKRSEVTISGAGHTYNSRLLLRLFRDPAAIGDSYTADAVISSIGVHYTANPLQQG